MVEHETKGFEGGAEEDAQKWLKSQIYLQTELVPYTLYSFELYHSKFNLKCLNN